MRIVVTGGSGVLGAQVVEQLRAAGHEPVVLSRGPGPGRLQGDVATGEGLAPAFAGADVLLHAASAAAEFTKIKATDIEGTRRVLSAAEAAGIKHLVYISIVGIDRIDYGYYKAKLTAENTIKAGSVPWSILRATQFHDLIDRVLRATARGPFVVIPKGLRFQPVASAEVATRLTEVSLGAPTGAIEDFGGPEVLTADELALAWSKRRGRRRRVVRVPVPGKAGAGFRAGNHLCPDHRQGELTWAQWLEQAYADGRVPAAYGKPSGAGD